MPATRSRTAADARRASSSLRSSSSAAAVKQEPSDSHEVESSERKPSAKATRAKKQPRAKFDYSLDFHSVDFRRTPSLYRIGLGEQGVLSCEPYKGEILPLWRFKTPAIARESSAALHEKFEQYLDEDDFVGADMTRKFIQMGVTRARRYANWQGGRKYTGELDDRGKKIKVVKGPENEEKAESARIFGVVLAQVQKDEKYLRLAEEHRQKYEQPGQRHESERAVKEESLGEDIKVEEH